MVMKLKPQWDKISIWMNNSAKTEAVAQVRAQIVSMLGIPDKDVEYMVFKDELNKPQVPKKDWKNNKKNFNKNNQGDNLPIKRADAGKKD